MRRSVIHRLVLVVAAAATTVLSVGSAAVAAAPAGYRTVDLGTLGGDSSYATALNDRGHVVGSSQAPDGSWHGFLWRGGTMTDLGALRPTGVNNRDEVIGTVDFATVAYLWRDGRLIDLGNLGGVLNFAQAINDRGQVTGMSSDQTSLDVPFLWTGGKMRPVPLNTASDINNRSEISGSVAESGSVHAAVYRHGSVVALAAGPADRSVALRINERGWVVGWWYSADGAQARLWRHGTVTDLGTLGGDTSEPLAVNDRGEVLGVSQAAPAGDPHPFLWRAGVMTDLSVYGLESVADLNNRGDIAGSAGNHAVVYRPR